MPLTAVDRWLSVDEISEYLGVVSKDKVYTWISAMGMPAHRLGRLWKSNRAEVSLWSSQAARPTDRTTRRRESNAALRGESEWCW